MIRRLLATLSLLLLAMPANAQTILPAPGLLFQGTGSAGDCLELGPTGAPSVISFGTTCGGGGGGGTPGGTTGMLQYNAGSGVFGGISGATTNGTVVTLTNPIFSGTVAGNGTVPVGVLVSSSTTVNGQTCTLGSTCTVTAAATGVTIGTTTIGSGITNGLLYNNAGVLGNLASANSGVLVTSGVGAPSISTTLPDGLALGTPGSVTLTNATGLPISTGVSGLGAGIATFLATPSSANLAAAVTDETGSGALVFATSPTLVTPTLGVATATSINKVTLTACATGCTLTIADGKTLTDTSGVGPSLLLGATGGGFTAYGGVTCTNQFIRLLSAAGVGTCASVAIGSDVSGLGANVATFLATPSSANLRGALTDETGTGLAYFQGGDIGTPSAGVGTNLTALNASNLSSGTIAAARQTSRISCSVALAFGGASTGITYANSGPLCWYTPGNGYYSISISFTLTSVGSATGAATITGLPIATNNTAGLFQGCSMNGGHFGSSVTAFDTEIDPNTFIINLGRLNLGGFTSLTNADFTTNTNAQIVCFLITN